MKVSYKGDYALKIILDLAVHYPDHLVHTKDISRRQDVPQNYLEQILLTLRQGGFIQSKKGPNGGYSLTRNPKEISIGDVIRFIDGPIHPISCVDPDTPNRCDFVSKCGFYGIWEDVSLAIAGIIDNIHFDEIADRVRKLEVSAAGMYYI